MAKKEFKVEESNKLDVVTYRKRFIGSLDNVLSDVSSSLQSGLCLEFASSDELVEQEKAVGRLSSDIEACFELIKASSQEDYRNSSLRWSPAEKRREMRLPDMRYLIVHEETKNIENSGDEEEEEEGQNGSVGYPAGSKGKVLGFASFMITYEDGAEVVYIYEIHIAEQLRGKGVGVRLMRVVEGVAAKAEMAKVMLTVFMSNKRARNFYQKLGYVLDEFSPGPRKLRNGVVKEPDYQILSKPIGAGNKSKRIKTGPSSS